MPARRKCGPSRWSRPTPFRDLDDVRAGRLADVRDLVDERDARHQERVRGQLDHLGRVDVGAHDRRVDRRVERRDGVAVLLLERADDDPVRLHEVAHGAALGEELRVRRVADVVEPALVEAGAHLLAGADRHGRLHHEDRSPARARRQLVDDRPDPREVGVAGVRRRRVDADEQELAVGDVCHVEGVRQPPVMTLEQLGHVVLVERNVTALERLDLLRDDVADDDVVAELCEAHARHEADPAGAEDADLAHRAATLLRRLLGV